MGVLQCFSSDRATIPDQMVRIRGFLVYFWAILAVLVATLNRSGHIHSGAYRRLSGQRSESWFSEFFTAEHSDCAVDFVSRDRSTILEVQSKPQGMRGMYSGLLQVASELDRRPEANLGCLAINTTRIASERVECEWQQLRRLFVPTIAERLAIVAVREGEVWFDPPGSTLEQLATTLSSHPTLGFAEQHHLRRVSRTSRQAEIFKTLLSRWLLDRGRIGIGDLGKLVGGSYPTVRKALDSVGSTEPALE